MPAYRHYRLDGSGTINEAEWLDAADDADAIRQARERKLNVPSEVWQRSRRIATIDPTLPD